MNPSTNNERAGLHLSSPVEQAGPVVPETPAQTGPENAPRPASAEAAPSTGQQGSALAMPLPVMPLPDPAQPIAATQTVANGTTSVVAPSTADDNDLIEKEWVNKAKQIVEKNREDPYNQSREMTIFKADYMKKRYNKVIKLSE